MDKGIEALIADMKAAALRATPGVWEMEGENIWYFEGGYTKHLLYAYQGDDVGDHQDDLNTRYIAAVSPANVLELLAALEQARQDGEELTKFKEVMTQAAHAVKDGNPIDLESMFKGELASAMFATMFAGEFVRHGAKNYLELLYAVPDFGDFTVTIQKKDGITPCERIAELEAAPNGMMQLSNELAEMKRKCVELEPSKLSVKQPTPATTFDAAAAIRACMDEFPLAVQDIVEECAVIAENTIRAAGGAVEGSE